MASTTIIIDNKLPADVGLEIAKRAIYCDRSIINSSYNHGNNSLEINFEDSADQTELTSKVQLLINKMKTNRLAIQPKIIRERNRAKEKFDPNVIEKLEATKDIFHTGLGTISKSGNFLKIFLLFDSLFEQIGLNIFNAEKNQHSTLIPTGWLKKAGYFSSFAHSVTFAMHLKEDFHQLENFASRHKQGEDLNIKSIDELETPEYCLSPAVCYHNYGRLQNYRFNKNDNGLKTFTALGRCFRYESKNITDLDRLWEFSMREIIFIGEKDKVLKARTKSIEIIWRMIEILDLTAKLETASDPFFSTDFNSLRYFQLANDLKFELNLPVSPDKAIAAASFNYHENFFGNQFNITTEDTQNVHTGCAAFGLERLVYASLAQLGIEKTMNRLKVAKQELLK